MDEATRNALMLEVHRLIEDAARTTVDQLRSASGAEPTYPPGAKLSPAQANALANLNPDALDGLRVLLADACAQSFFDFFSLLDGVSDPEVTEVPDWIGLELVEPNEDEDRPMLHDELHESHRKYRSSSGGSA